MKAVLGFALLLLAWTLPAVGQDAMREFITPWIRMQSDRPVPSSRGLFAGWSTAWSAGLPEDIRSPKHGGRSYQPGDRVGIKVAAAGRSVSGTNPEVVDAIVDGLAEAGMSARNIIVWDKSIEDLLAAGFKKDGARYVLERNQSQNGI